MLSDIIQHIGDESGYSVVTSNILDSNDVTTKQLVAMCNRLAKEMADAFNWTKLRKTGAILLSEGISSYAFPLDFSYYHYETFWNQSDKWQLFGPMTQREYAASQGYGFTATVYDQFQIRGCTDTELTIYPTPGAGTDGEIVIYEYTSARPVRPRTWAAGQVTAIGDYSFANGIYYIATTAGTTAGASVTTDSNVTWAVYHGKYENFLADTDVCVLNERILEQGVMERFGSIKELNVMPLYQAQLEDEFSKNVPGKIVYAGGTGRSRFQLAKDNQVVFGSRV